ncbi:MAG: methylmalonyl Co-A mutase-associated GTPase MeaB [Sphingobacteriales bacterium UTBCD1]|jgi:LAO/AO transport system kinase|nr:MAG: methylmalonyl Co-A mutase-associated GTPase MeaB [Sphingobacteriales bacterium UTBCD1]
MWQDLLKQLRSGDKKALARSISLVENERPDYQLLLQNLPSFNTKTIGITGPPGSGKSTLTNALIGYMTENKKKVAVLCVDPSSPFNHGAVLGDRIRMNEWYTHPDVFIRSLATRGSLGGLHPKTIEITDMLKASGFDYIIIETVGVGQSEVEIAGLADVTIVVVVPEAGDEVQTMKAGLMEIADIFVVNKGDRPDADLFVKYLQMMLAPAFHSHYHEIPVVKTIATQKETVKGLYENIMHELQKTHSSEKKFHLLAEKAYMLIRQKRMKDVNRDQLKKEIEQLSLQNNFNLYRFVSQF